MAETPPSPDPGHEAEVEAVLDEARVAREQANSLLELAESRLAEASAKLTKLRRGNESPQQWEDMVRRGRNQP